MDKATLYETIKSRALEVLHKTVTPSELEKLRQRADGWALKNRVAAAVTEASTDRPRVGKVESARIQRDILRSMVSGPQQPGSRRV